MQQGRTRVGMLVLGAFCAVLLAPGLPAADAGSAPLLWQVRKADAQNAAVFLFAAVAVPNTTFLSFDPAVRGAFDASERLVLPNDSTRRRPGKTIALLLRKGALPEGDSLQQRLPPELYERFIARARASGVGVRRVSRVFPWFAALVLRTADLERNAYVDENEFFYYFDGLARGYKETRMLSTGAEAFDRANSMSPEVQIGVVELAIAGSEAAGEILPASHAAWLAGDVQALETALFSIPRDRPEFLPVLEHTLFAENERLAGDVEELLAEGDASFLVLPAHNLVGDRGLLARLRERGFVVERRGSGGS
jgi:uncharacterized protein YbaP (TraB family)